MKNGTVVRVLLAMTALAAHGCDREPSIDETAKGKGDTAGLTRDLPPGRFQLPTLHTPAPDLWITLPEGYQVKVTGQLPNDEFFVIRSDDPSLHDTTAVTPGFMRIHVGVRPQTAIDSTELLESNVSILDGRPVSFRTGTERLPGGEVYLKRELRSPDFFAAVSPDLAKTPLHLHVYVAGVDKATVDALIQAAGSIALAP